MNKECEKCGQETINKIIGDESCDYCPVCNWFTHGVKEDRDFIKRWGVCKKCETKEREHTP